MNHVESTMEKKTMSPAEVESFVKECEYEVKEESPLSCCVDGRYDSSDRAAAAAPGADAGKMLEALAALRYLGLPMSDALRAEVLDKVVEAVGGAGNFRFHTDTHAADALKDRSPEESVARGCGHMRLASENPADYQLSSEDMDAIFGRLAQLRAGEVVLDGSHGEAAVLVVSDRKKSLAHQTGSVQAFVYHEGWDNARLEILAAKLAEIEAVKKAGQGPERLTEVLVSMAALQRNLTLAKLAQGLPLYQVDNGITEAGFVGELEKAA